MKENCKYMNPDVNCADYCSSSKCLKLHKKYMNTVDCFYNNNIICKYSHIDNEN